MDGGRGMMNRWFAMGRWSLGIGCAMVVSFWNGGAIAAERVVLRYRVLQASVSVDELTELAETGRTSPALRAYLRLARRDPQELRHVLNQEAEVNPLLLDQVLNSSVGDQVLDQVGRAIHTPSERANREALRAALVLSAEDDSRVSLIEVLQNYPTEEVHVNGNRLEAAYNQIVAIQTRIENILEGTGLF
jgi:Alpha/beta hydrolase of unknown function (DUF1400)